MTNIRFDDIDAINAAVTESFGDWSDEIEITQEMINGFAELTGDHQWIHVDVERAKQGPFGTPIAHGFLTLSLLPKLVASKLNVTGYRNVVNYGADSLRFIAPVPVGSRVHARTRPLGAKKKERGTLLKSEVAVHVVGAEKPVLVYQMLTLYMG